METQIPTRSALECYNTGRRSLSKCSASVGSFLHVLLCICRKNRLRSICQKYHVNSYRKVNLSKRVADDIMHHVLVVRLIRSATDLKQLRVAPEALYVVLAHITIAT